MPESVPDYDSHIKTLERKLRSLKRNIISLSTAREAASADDSLRDQFTVHHDLAEAHWTSYQEIWDELDRIYVLIEKEDQFPSKAWEEHYDQVQREIIDARALRLRLKTREEPNEAHQNTLSESLSQALGALNLNGSDRAQLPKISIPSFSGNIFHWTSFKDSFVSLIHNNSKLPKVDKLHYLMQALQGEALSLICRFPKVEDSYDLAWEKLMDTYDNPRVLASMYLQRILDSDCKGNLGERQRYEQFLTHVGDSIEGFLSLNLANPADFILCALALRSLNPETRKHFELTRSSQKSMPSAADVIDFVRQRLMAFKLSRDMESSSSSLPGESRPKSDSKPKYPNRGSYKYNAVSLHATGTNVKRQSPVPRFSTPGNKAASSGLGQGRQFTPPTKSHGFKALSNQCPFCQGKHLLAFCIRFASLAVDRRSAFIVTWKGCSNCLREGHISDHCPSKFSCKFCKGRHHSLIHEEKASVTETSNQDRRKSKEPDKPRTSETFIGFESSFEKPSYSGGLVFLGTIQALIKCPKGKLYPIRAVLDSGSQHTFITSRLARQIGVSAETFKGNVCGLGDSKIVQPLSTALCVIQPYSSTKEYRTKVLIVERITSALPNFPAPPNVHERFASLPLADQDFAKPVPVDALIGSDLYPQLINGAPFKSEVGDLYLIPSVFGLVVSGKLESTNSTDLRVLFSLSSAEIDSKLKMFWELEEPTPTSRRNPEDDHCERHFQNTHSRAKDGRYQVELPLRSNRIAPGFNRDVATQRFLALEQKFRRNPKLQENYSQFMREYIDLGHMSSTSNISNYVIPHHGVWQHRPEGSKLRVVFDASCKTSTHSLNDILYAGPKLQNDISNILTQFRLYLVPLCTDIVKMYRQILMHPKHRELQHIFWRFSPEDALQEYALNTVTYGVTSSAFQAIRVVQQLNQDEGANYSLASSAIQNCIYVDDIVTGADSLEEALELQRQLIALFSKGGFQLSKWASSFPELIPKGEVTVDTFTITPENGDSIKILGLVWDPLRDAFGYSVSQPPVDGATKRIILSAVARIFDPLGLLAPVIFMAKTLLQSIWKERLDWDDQLPAPIDSCWRELCEEWSWLSSILVPRYISLVGPSYRLVGFCDASAKGYAATVYLRAEDHDGEVRVHLLKAKTKVAPMKFLTISRLELCGALLLSRLISSFTFPEFRHLPPQCFTDSKVVISWLCTPTYKLKVFEAHRVSSILDADPLSSWRHVASMDNPADLGSRGCYPKKLIKETLWWQGPAWLMNSPTEWPGLIEPPSEVAVAMSNFSQNPVKMLSMDEWMSRFSGLDVLVRTVARLQRLQKTSSTQKFNGPILAEEYQTSLSRCIRAVQRELLPAALYQPDERTPHAYCQLTPFMDKSGMIKVGGRLQNAPIEDDAKHPLLIPRESHLARMIVDNIHQKNFHSGPSLTLALVRARFWIPKAPKLIRGRILRCVQCRIRKAKPNTPLMGSLPRERFAQYRAFLQVGVDYAGPFAIKVSNRRNAAMGKAYLCIFICMATKAVHLEAVSSLSTSAFLDALDRFIARRGVPNTLWSDHGTNFVGASRFLKDLLRFQRSIENSVINHLAPKGITWKFIPPRAPNFGGLWEAGVKSVKSLLPRAVGMQPSTFEDLSTTFAKIEGLLNSRPLCALKEDPEDFDFLTPGHFLLGSHPTHLPQASAEDPPSTPSLPSWRLIQLEISQVWNRWRREYLHTLLQRSKWTRTSPNLKVGDLVILVEKRPAIGHWPVGRVVETFPGRDGVTRSVVVRTPSGNHLTRAVSSLVPLFPPEDEESKET